MSAVERSFVSLPSATAAQLPVGSNPCQGLWYAPAGGKARTAIIATHYSADMSEHFLARRLAARGIGFLGWNTRYRGAEDAFLIEHALVDMAAGVRWLRETQRIERLVLLGNSGGGSLMAAYQSQATRPSLAAPEGSPLADALQSLPRADAYISLNSHLGRPEYLTAIIDPSVTDESDPVATDGSLDMYDAANGPPYSPAFVRQYRVAQAARNARISTWAIEEQQRLRARGHTDRTFTVHRVWADLRFLDGALDPSDRRLDACYAGKPAVANRGAAGVARAVTLTTWLSLWSLEHSQCRAAPHLRNIDVPALVVQSLHDVGVFPSDARAIHEALASADKQLELIPGTHFLDEPANARDAVADLMTQWLRNE